ncbi:hypothetical protein RHMOL_Rhmol04G0359400 [Rhododendron molle]|uniref:Uncharacterized protein n=1 Tax=Rhododendron molle TaxID=49168 RepID=A0ACC0PAD9_RHOML|nr:hypothetical protein RHMOL_Rhmol04G0359400 [Rhododendron molle]
MGSEKMWVPVSKPVGYIMREQRLVFVLVGISMATAFFSARPWWSPSPNHHVQEVAADLFPTQSAHRVTYQVHSALMGHVSAGGRIPLGLNKKGLRIAVTGGAGFVGSHLVDRLIQRGDSVIVIDNFFTGRKENLIHHYGNPRFELIRHDVVEPILLEVDQIYHLACPASPVHYKFNPVKTMISFFFFF